MISRFLCKSFCIILGISIGIVSIFSVMHAFSCLVCPSHEICRVNESCTVKEQVPDTKTVTISIPLRFAWYHSTITFDQISDLDLRFFSTSIYISNQALLIWSATFPLHPFESHYSPSMLWIFFDEASSKFRQRTSSSHRLWCSVIAYFLFLWRGSNCYETQFPVFTQTIFDVFYCSTTICASLGTCI